MAASVVDQGSHAHLTLTTCRVRLERLELRAVLTYMDCTGAESFNTRTPLALGLTTLLQPADFLLDRSGTSQDVIGDEARWPLSS